MRFAQKWPSTPSPMSGKKFFPRPRFQTWPKKKSEPPPLEDSDAAQNCEVFGDVYAVTAGVEATVHILTADARGQRCANGGATFAATLANAERLYELKVSDKNDGGYLCKYAVSAAGEYKLSIEMNGHDVFGSPFPVRVAPSSADPDETLLLRGLRTATPGVGSALRIATRDKFGNKCRTGGEALEAAVDGPASVVSLTDHGDGTYTAVYEVDTDYDGSAVVVSVTLRGRHIRGSPFSPDIPYDPASSRQRGPRRKRGGGRQPPRIIAPKATSHPAVPETPTVPPPTAKPPQHPQVPTKAPHTKAKKKPSPTSPVETVSNMLRTVDGDASIGEALANARLRPVFDHYARHLSDIQGGVRYLALDDDDDKTTRGFAALARDFDIVPNLLTRKQLARCFSAVTTSRRADPAGLTYDQFRSVVAVVALVAFSKPHYEVLHATNVAKLELLLERWGLADSIRLDDILRGRRRRQ